MPAFLKLLPFKLKKTSSYSDEQPIREEIFSVERLEQYAQTLAAEHKIIRKKGRAQLLPRLEDNGRKLVAAYRTLVETIQVGRAISPAAEWLVDNFHIVEEQLREIREDLPKSYYYELPKLADGPLKDYPRIYAVALALIAHRSSEAKAARPSGEPDPGGFTRARKSSRTPGSGLAHCVPSFSRSWSDAE